MQQVMPTLWESQFRARAAVLQQKYDDLFTAAGAHARKTALEAKIHALQRNLEQCLADTNTLKTNIIKLKKNAQTILVS